MDLNDANRLKKLERENTELKKMLAEALLAKRVLGCLVEKNYETRTQKVMVEAVVSDGLCSGRAGCRILRKSRGTWWYRARRWSDAQQQVVQRLHVLSAEHPRYGFIRSTLLLWEDGWLVRKRQVQQLCRLEGLRLPPAKRRLSSEVNRQDCDESDASCLRVDVGFYRRR